MKLNISFLATGLSKAEVDYEIKPCSLTVQLQNGVVDFALDLACALECTRHPQTRVHGHRGDDVVADISRHLPLGQNGADY